MTLAPVVRDIDPQNGNSEDSSMMSDELKALRAFAKAVDAAAVFDWGSRRSNPCGESIGEIRADRMDDDSAPKLRKIQKWRDRLVALGVLEAVR